MKVKKVLYEIMLRFSTYSQFRYETEPFCYSYFAVPTWWLRKNVRRVGYESTRQFKTYRRDADLIELEKIARTDKVWVMLTQDDM